jgi:hypothetical protein
MSSSSDSTFSLAANCKSILSKIDDDWLSDSLSDDEVAVPKGDEDTLHDEDVEEEIDLGKDIEDEVNTWEDLGLAEFTGPSQI